MPYIQIRIHTPQPLAQDALHHLGAETTRLMADVMRKRREVTVVEIVTPPSLWFACGQPCGGKAVEADIKITQGSNSAADKAALLAAMQTLFAATLGELSVPAYVVIHEIPSTDWGYDGLPQAQRLPTNWRG